MTAQPMPRGLAWLFSLALLLQVAILIGWFLWWLVT